MGTKTTWQDLTIQGFEDFIMAQPADKKINQRNWSTCAVGDFMDDNGVPRKEGLTWFDRKLCLSRCSEVAVRDISCHSTYGSAQRRIASFNSEANGYTDE